MGMVMPQMSASWKASVPMALEETWPVIATIGTESMWASAIGVTRLVAPGPEVAMHTPTLPVACAYPVAAWPAPCSCRTSTCRTLVESSSGSYAGRMVPPGMPKTTSQPTASSDRTSDCAPVTRTGAPDGGAGLGRLPGVGAPGLAAGRDVALVIGSASWVGGVGVRTRKNPRRPDGSHEGRASTGQVVP